MRTLKFALIAAIVSLALMSNAGEITKPSKKVICITLNQAQADAELVKAMYTQLTTDFLKDEHPGLYSTCVRCRGNVYRVFATRPAWIRFFRNKPVWSVVSIYDQ